MKAFVGRKVEKEQLAALIDRPRPCIAVIYGRRRVGKSELIRQATHGKNVLSFEGLEGQPKQKQIKNLLFQLSEQSGLCRRQHPDVDRNRRRRHHGQHADRHQDERHPPLVGQ